MGAGLKIRVLAVGKLRERYLASGIEEYRSRLGHYADLAIDEVVVTKASRLPEGPERNNAEGEEILRRISPGEFVIALDERGKELTSRVFSEFLQQRMNRGESRLCFVIGGAGGLSEAVKQRADYSLSLSRLTFPHQLCRLILVEQLYRSFTILHGTPYHKD